MVPVIIWAWDLLVSRLKYSRKPGWPRVPEITEYAYPKVRLPKVRIRMMRKLYAVYVPAIMPRVNIRFKENTDYDFNHDIRGMYGLEVAGEVTAMEYKCEPEYLCHRLSTSAIVTTPHSPSYPTFGLYPNIHACPLHIAFQLAILSSLPCNQLCKGYGS